MDEEPKNLRREISTKATSPEGVTGAILDFRASDGTLDRYQEVIDARGWKLANYQKNPVFQDSHRYDSVADTIGKALTTEIRDGALVQRIEFAVDANPLAKVAYQLYKGGFLNAVSVGFRPLKWEDGKSGEAYRRKYIEQELLEVSAVSIPCNPNALMLGFKAGAVEQRDIKALLDMYEQICSKTATPGGPAGASAPGSHEAQAAEINELTLTALAVFAKGL